MKQITIFAVCLLVCSSYVLADVTETERFEHTVPLDGAKSVKVSNVNGEISIEGWSKKSIHVVATKSAEADTRGAAREILKKMEIEIQRDGKNISISTKFPDNSGGRVDYQIKVPTGIECEAATVNGNLRIENAAGPVEGATVNGNINIVGARETLSAATVNGNVHATLDGQPSGDLECATVSGSITLEVDANLKASIDASTMTGDIRAFFPIEKSSGFLGKSASGKLNGGGVEIELRTVNGNIEIKKR